MIRAVLLALALALGGGAPYFGLLLDGSTIKIGNSADPNGTSTNGGTIFYPNGGPDDTDAGNHYDPNG